jgi:RNA polymerase sigma factor (sigma-70 family)
MGSSLDSLLAAYARLPIPSREEQLLLGRAIRAWLDWEPSPEQVAKGKTQPPPGLKRAGQRARDQLVARNMLLVAKQARAFSIRTIVALDVEDLIQEGAIGLIRAAEKFDPARGCTFSTYAVWWIRQSMNVLLHTSGPVKVPVKRAASMNRLRQWVEAFTAREGRSPTDAEAMEALDLSAADLLLLRKAAAVRQVISLDAFLGGDEDGESWGSTVAAPAADVTDDDWEVVLEVLQPWPDVHEVMARLLSGQSHADVSRAMGLTRAATVRLEAKGTALARVLANQDGLTPGEDHGEGDGMLVERQLSQFSPSA